jgi:hypothetical protein
MMENGAAFKVYNNRAYKTGYRPEYCGMIIKHAEEGRNLAEFAAKLNITFSTLKRWVKAYPEFKKAKETAKLKHAAYWEELKRNAAQKQFTYPKFLFVMVSTFGYRNPKRPPKN